MPIALITGASRGLGAALAAGFAAHGWTLILDARDGSALLAAAAALPRNAEVVPVAGDITDPAHREALATEVRRRGGLDLLVHNAGALGPSPLPRVADLPPAELRALLETNVVAPLALTQLLLPSLRQRRGTVLAVTSDAAVEPYPTWGGYGSSKAALEQLVAVLAQEEPELRIHAVDPGDLRTAMHQAAFPGEDITDRPLPATVVPAFLHLVDAAPPSGRVRAADLLPVTGGVA